MDELSVPSGRHQWQEAFWTGVDRWTRQQVTGLLERVLLSEQKEQIAAGWNE